MENKYITPLSKDYNFNEILVVFKDIVYDPSRENITNILQDYGNDSKKNLYGYFLENKLIGIIGIKENKENNEILHFGIHPEYRGKKLGTELIDFIKSKGKTMILSTDDDAIKFYEKYGFKYTSYFSERYQKIRYDCIYEK